MMNDAWTKVTLRFPPDCTDAMYGFLADNESIGIEERDAEGGRTEWLVYLPAGAVPAGFADELRAALGPRAPDVELVSIEPVRNENWNDNWRQYFHPVDVGGRLRVVPSWEKETAAASDRLTILMEPGMAFGTGTHATTQLCMAMAERLVRPGARVLDVGTGTTILLISALLLGAAGGVGTDIDPDVLENAHANLELNGVEPGRVRVEIMPLAELPDRAFDLVFCNMLSHEFLPLLADIRARVADDGTVLFSGMLETEREAVTDALRAAGFAVCDEQGRDEWLAFAARPC